MRCLRCKLGLRHSDLILVRSTGCPALRQRVPSSAIGPPDRWRKRAHWTGQYCNRCDSRSDNQVANEPSSRIGHPWYVERRTIDLGHASESVDSSIYYAEVSGWLVGAGEPPKSYLKSAVYLRRRHRDAHELRMFAPIMWRRSLSVVRPRRGQPVLPRGFL